MVPLLRYPWPAGVAASIRPWPPYPPWALPGCPSPSVMTSVTKSMECSGRTLSWQQLYQVSGILFTNVVVRARQGMGPPDWLQGKGHPVG